MGRETELDLGGNGYNFCWLKIESGYQGNRKEEIALTEQ